MGERIYSDDLTLISNELSGYIVQSKEYHCGLQEDRLIEMLMKAEEQVYNSQTIGDKKVYTERYINILDYICYKYLTKQINESFIKDVVANPIINAHNKFKCDYKMDNLDKVMIILFSDDYFKEEGKH